MLNTTPNFQDLLASALKNIIKPEDILAKSDNFIIAMTQDKRLVYVSSINDLSMLYIEADNQGFSLPFNAYPKQYALVVSGLSSTFNLNAESNRETIFETLNRGFICYLIPEGTTYQINHPAQEEGCLNLMLLHEGMADYESIVGAKESETTKVVNFLRKEFDFEIGRLLKKLKDSLNQDRLDYVIYQSYMFQFYAAYLMRFHKVQSGIVDRAFRQIDIKVAKAAAIIEGDLKAFVSVPDIAQKVGINQASLQQGFKQNIGCTINEFVKQKRLSRAADMLRTSDLNISEIVYEVGLNSKSYFSELFRKHNGMSPREFREAYLKKEVQDVGSSEG